MKFGIGQSVRRVEDARFITGQGRYTDDIKVAGMAHAVVLRSPYGHARIRAMDTSAAQAAPGILLVVTGADTARYGNWESAISLEGLGSDFFVPTPRPLLASETARLVGDAVAFIVAETREAAVAAAELVDIDYEDLPAVESIDAARADGAALVWPEAAGNIAYDWSNGNADVVEAGFARAAHVAELRIVHNRVAPTALEVRAALGEWDADAGFTLTATTQGVTAVHQVLCAVLGEPAARIRLRTPDVGGGFGAKMFFYPEYALVLHAARVLGRPVKWAGERSDAFQSDTHGRDLISHAALALDAEGRFLALRVTSDADVGAYHSTYGPAIQTIVGGRMLGGAYRIPGLHNHVRGIFTNTAVLDAYRGAGRPECTYITERLVEAAARISGIPADRLRQINLIRPDELPYTTPLGVTYDVGDFPGLHARALEAADTAGFAARRTEAAARGQLLGRGVACYAEICGFTDGRETADVRFLPEGIAEVAMGTQSTGQGHETAFAQIFADRLQIPMEQVRIVQGDTARLELGGGTSGSRSAHLGGSACLGAADAVRTTATEVAAAEMGVSAGDIDYADGVFRARGSNAAVGLFELALRHPGRLDVRNSYETAAPVPTFPNGCHICEVEIDRETGKAQVVRYSIVDDFGTIINPLLLQGQVHGGVAQGLGQALIESVVYGDGAQLLTGSFMDYGIARADDMPPISFESRPVPTPGNPLGVKGAGEAGTIGATPAVVNAINDALAHAGAGEIEMPATPEVIWRALAGR